MHKSENTSFTKYRHTKWVMFALGCLIGCATTLIVLYGVNPHYKSYNYEDEVKREQMRSALDERGIMYSYEIDHLGRHWITPMVDDDNLISDIESTLD